MKKIVITGVSTGIGFSTAKILCNSGYLVYGSVRKEEDAQNAKKEFGENFTPLIFDVTDAKAIQENAEMVKNELKPGEVLSGLVNNAGVAMGGPVSLIDTDVFRKQFEVNFFGLIDVTKACLPLLGARKGSNNQGKINSIIS